MKQTGNYKLNKPEGTDVVNIEDLNANMDILDAEVAKKVDKVASKGLSTNDYSNAEKAEVAKVKNKADKTYVDNKVKTDVPLNAKFTDTQRAISDSVTSASSSVSASSQAVKTAMDRANSAFTSADNGKVAIRNAVIGVDSSVVIPSNPSFTELAGAIGGISTGKKWLSGTSVVGSSKNLFDTNVRSESRYYATVTFWGVVPSLIIWHIPGEASYGVVLPKGYYHNDSQYNIHVGNTLTLDFRINMSKYGTLVPVGLGDSYVGKEVHWLAFE